MKGLLHSKRFRRNLKRWICMYVGVLVLFTSVVTYSRYVSKFSSSSSAKVSKFNIEIQKGEVKTSSNSDPIMPTDEIYYTFKVIREFEVKTLLVLTVNAEPGFLIEKIEEADTNLLIYSSDLSYENNYKYSKDGYQVQDNNQKIVSITKPITYLEGQIHKTYKVTLKFDYSSVQDTYYKFKDKDLKERPIVNLDYSATQDF